MSAFHELVLPGLDGRELPLAPLKEQLTLVVNVASECGLTPQYAGLQELHQRYQERGFGVLGIPCNQFGAQEPGSDAAISMARNATRCIACWQAKAQIFRAI